MGRIGFALVVATWASMASADDQKLIYAVFWEGCEHACNGFKDAIADSGLDAEILIRGAEQDKARLPGFVQEARALGADLVLTYGTSVTLGMAGTLEDVGEDRFIQDIPLVFMQVADPFATRIAESFEGSGRGNLTGTFNRVPESVNIEVIRAYDPSFQRLGLLYNSNERNSVLKRDELQALSETMGFELVAMELDPGNDGAPGPAVIPLRMAELRDRGIDFMYLGSSSFLRVNGALFTASALENGIPVLSPYENLVRDHDALLSIAARAYDVGVLAAQQALRILRDGATPGDLPIAQVTDFAYVVNMRVARDLGRFPPFTFMQIAEVTE
jgi:putative ABC transport system substrate-binding protein